MVKYFSLYQNVLIMIGAISITEGGCGCAKRPMSQLTQTKTSVEAIKPSELKGSVLPSPNALATTTVNKVKNVAPPQPFAGLPNLGKTSYMKAENPAPSQPFAGLPNLGSTCYMNAVLQIIAALYPAKRHNSTLKNLIDDINTKKQPLDRKSIEKFRETMKAACNSSRLQEIFSSNKQEDANEFLMLLNQECNILDAYQVKDHLVFHNKKHTTYSEKELHNATMLRISFHDPTRISEEKNTDAKTMLATYYKASTNISDMINFDRETMQNNAIYNFNNKDMRLPFSDMLTSVKEQIKNPITLKQIVYAFPAPQICIALNRFSFHNNTNYKIPTQVQGTAKITIRRDPNKAQGNDTFNLYGFIVHVGNESNRGHYIAYVKRQEKWYQANDDIITEYPASAAIDASKDSYLLFYKKDYGSSL